MKHSYIAKRFQSSGAGLSLDTEAVECFCFFSEENLGK